MTRSLLKLQEVNPGFDPERVLVMRVSPNWSKYTTNQQYRDFALRLQETMKTQPGILSAALSSNYPLSPFSLSNGPFQRNFQIEGKLPNDSELAPQADVRVATSDYFETLRLPTISGRVFTNADHDKSQPVAVINQTLARHRWGNENPIGRRISLDQGATWITIVGIIGDVRHYGLQQEPTDEIYFPVAQRGGANFLLLRTAAEPESVIRQARQAVYGIDSETAIDQVSTLEERHSEALASPRLTATLLDLFAVLALVITVVGLTGVMALSVAQRSHELGIRMALGATQGNVMWMVLQQGLKLVLIGLVIGMVGALALTRVLTRLLFAVEPTDPLTFVAVSLALLGVAALACWLPTRRVTSIDPLLALRNE
jgi:predicted permease